jgi:hypothetical protein
MRETRRAGVGALAILLLGGIAVAADWPDWRGPDRDGRSAERGLPERWSPGGENLAWKAPYGARSTPVVADGHVYLVNGVGAGASLQERLLALDADTGKLAWEQRWNVFHSDVPPHRIGWSSPVVDRATGNLYAFGVAARSWASRATAGGCGSARWPRSSASSRPTAAAPSRP